MPHEMMIALTVIFALFCGMIIRTIWLLQKENKKKGVRIYNREPMKMSIGERLRRKHKHFNGRFFW